MTGAKGVVGAPLCESLQSDGIAFVAVSRGVIESYDTSCQLTWNLNQKLPQVCADWAITSLIHCAPLWLLERHLTDLSQHGLKSIVAFSSTSIEGKHSTSSPKERQIVSLLKDAEQSLQASCEQLGISLTLLRPSLIYGYRRDQNIYKIAQTIKRFGVVPVVGQAIGLRQPVHADDLVNVALNALRVQASKGKQLTSKTYNVVGGETMTYADMLERIFVELGKPVRIIRLPLWLMRFGLRVLGVLTRGGFTPDMANRMNQHLVYDDQLARTELDYTPRDFNPKIGLDL